VDRIPQETARQTDTQASINHQLAAAADTDVQLAESFVKFKGDAGPTQRKHGQQHRRHPPDEPVRLPPATAI
jgi:hypothetical protein